MSKAGFATAGSATKALFIRVASSRPGSRYMGPAPYGADGIGGASGHLKHYCVLSQ